MTGGEDDVAARVEQVQRRADQRFPRAVVASGVVGVVTAVVLGAVGGHQHHGRHAVLAALFGLVVGLLVVVCGTRLFLRRRMRLGLTSAIFAGLSRAQRREVNRSVRLGRPSPDPVMRRIAARSAKQNVQQGRWTLPIFVIGAALELGNAVFNDNSPGWRAFYYLGAAMFVVMAGGSVWLSARARRYLQVVGDEGGDGGRAR